MTFSSKSSVILLAAVLLMGAGCDKSNKQQDTAPASTPSTAAQAASTPAASASAAEVELTDEDIPVAEDYIEESTKEIDEKNYKSKLAEIEKEIDSDNE